LNVLRVGLAILRLLGGRIGRLSSIWLSLGRIRLRGIVGVVVARWQRNMRRGLLGVFRSPLRRLLRQLLLRRRICSLSAVRRGIMSLTGLSIRRLLGVAVSRNRWGMITSAVLAGTSTARMTATLCWSLLVMLAIGCRVTAGGVSRRGRGRGRRGRSVIVGHDGSLVSCSCSEKSRVSARERAPGQTQQTAEQEMIKAWWSRPLQAVESRSGTVEWSGPGLRRSRSNPVGS